MIQAERITNDELEEEASGLGIALPIEQTAAWARYQATIEGRTPWGGIRFRQGEKTVALASLIDYETHGYHYLRGAHAPAWCAAPSPEQETEALDALRELVRREARGVVFVRLAVAHELPETRPCLSTVPYDTTVVVDLTGGDDEILARMKPRGRRDVRKALRESPVLCADETERATASFDEYYEVMVETAERDGFAPAPRETYQDMISILGPDHCRVFAARDPEGTLVSWAISTISGERAVYYYAASSARSRELLATDRLFYFECCELARLGCTSYDLMGIGSDFSPSLLGLNTFKTKFAKDGERPVAPDRDLPVRPLFYKALVTTKKVRDR